MIHQSRSFSQTRSLGKKLAENFKEGEVICLYGNLGAGKTTFIAGVVDYFLPGKRVISPTFIIVRHYRGIKGKINNIFHIDLYRLDELKDIEDLGFKDFISDKNSIVLIEWAEKAAMLLPDNRTDIYFKVKEKNIREIEVKKL